MVTDFDASRALLHREKLFEPFTVESTLPLREALSQNLIAEKDELLVVERGGQRLAFSEFQMIYHHIAQGELAREPYLVVY
ncbi:DUF3179 domain-containing (seleno)protein [Paludifilum halophilum]|uniref:Uncharacterized protein n=1 Tax=Paludifilum halophilum TaxID=1642702 RepID=A0A235B4X2_9BACL|nr:DUF3179 domain-containing (seleno)protein [Paludifilum halophilum]OYD07281.1 hypothetical protein CHM34_12960 [Paludifilum halophilum]